MEDPEMSLFVEKMMAKSTYHADRRAKKVEESKNLTENGKNLIAI